MKPNPWKPRILPALADAMSSRKSGMNVDERRADQAIHRETFSEKVELVEVPADLREAIRRALQVVREGRRQALLEIRMA